MAMTMRSDDDIVFQVRSEGILRFNDSTYYCFVLLCQHAGLIGSNQEFCLPPPTWVVIFVFFIFFILYCFFSIKVK